MTIRSYISGGGGGGGTGLTQAQVDARINTLTPALVEAGSNQYHGDVADAAGLLVLDAEQGDTARTLDTGERWRLVGTDPTNPADWEIDTASHDPFMSNDLFLTP